MAAPQPDGALVHNLLDASELPLDIAIGRRAAAAARRVVAGLTASSADAATLEEVAAGLETLAAVLDPHRPATRFPASRHDRTPDEDHRFWESHPFIGPGHPLAPPIRIMREGEQAVGTATFGHVYEGPQGCVHGGIIAAMFDMVLGAASSFTRRSTLTGTLSVRYRRPTPIGEPIRFAGWIDRVGTRTTTTKGASWSGDELLAEAEAVFVRVDRTPPGDSAVAVTP